MSAFPYRDAAETYRKLGWQGTLPIGFLERGGWEPRRKDNPPVGYTGAKAGDRWPDDHVVRQWMKRQGDLNIGLRPPDGLIGLDVDQYGTKRGLDNLKAFASKRGLGRIGLADTIRSTARGGDQPSGIYWLRTLQAHRWADGLVDGVEVVQFGHRYAVVWPSIHPDGAVYQWWHDGEIIEPPSVDDARFRWLPDDWVEAFTVPAAPPADHPPAGEHRETVWSEDVRRVHQRATSKLGVNGSDHNSARTHVAALARLEQQDHAGATAALDQLEMQFLATVSDPVTKGANVRSDTEAGSEWRRLLNGGRELIRTTNPPIPDLGTISSNSHLDEDAFWNARDALAHIRDYARARRASPWATLGVVIARLAAAVPPYVLLPPLVGTHGSLNLFVVLVGPPGSGKDAALGAGSDAIDVGDITTSGPGSGEGVAHLFARYRKPTKDEPGGIELHNQAVLLVASEVDTLAALTARQASTLSAELRKVWMGSELGFAYVDPTKRLRIPAHSYRLTLVVGAQPERAGPLLDDSDAGAPQRFLWLPATDPAAPDQRPDEPPGHTWEMPEWPDARHGRSELDVCDTARDVIDTARVQRLRGEGDPLDAHALFAREKVAALLAILDGGTAVTDDDWRLAGDVIARSNATRAAVVQRLEATAAEANRARGHAEGQRDVVRAEVVDEANIKRVARFLQRKLARDWTAHSDIRRKVPYRDRDYFDDALGRLQEAGLTEDRQTEHGTQYRLAKETS